MTEDYEENFKSAKLCLICEEPFLQIDDITVYDEEGTQNKKPGLLRHWCMI